MTALKGILKYSLYLFIAGWMFVLGIMVGRGNAPLEFDTGKFQKRLETIAREFGQGKSQEKKVELTFYDVLDQPPQKNTVIQPDQSVSEKKIEEKTSRKKQTYKPAPPEPLEKKTAQPARTEKNKTTGKNQTAVKPSSPVKTGGIYTVQIAAYRLEKDAAFRMDRLQKKGIISYKVSAESKGGTWYRVRSGSFATYDEAKAYQKKLEKMKIHGIVYKKDL